MIKKKAKSKTPAKKVAKKKSAPKKEQELNPAGVRKDISLRVEAEAGEMAEAVIAEGKKGQLATVKYLFEVASIYPAATDGGQATPAEDCLAQTLLHRLHLPEEPIAIEADDEPEKVGNATTPEVKAAGDESDGGDSGLETGGDERTDSVTA